MSAKLKVLGAGAIFFLASQSLVAQVKKSDSIKTKELETVVLLGVTKKKASEAVGNSVQLSSKDVIRLQLFLWIKRCKVRPQGW